MPKIMIIRHAEKPGDGNPHRGVTLDGAHDKHELTVRGWQRAGALVRFFAPHNDQPPVPPIATPRSIFASAVTHFSPSMRAQRTVQPLAAALGIAVDAGHANGEERYLAAAALAAPSPVLIAWHHNHIATLARQIAGGELPCPGHWPDDRFDVVWVLERPDEGGPWTFSQVPQCVIHDDCTDAIQHHAGHHKAEKVSESTGLG